MEMCDPLQELDNFSAKDCEGDISDVETFKIGDNNESESVAAVDEDKETSRVSATTTKPGDVIVCRMNSEKSKNLC